jgi:glyoxylase-like metal-dependent hydrolase (beta-lactamase superfamily II)
MLIETFTVGNLYTNCYVASCKKTKEAIIIDPGIEYPIEVNPIFRYIQEEDLKPKFIVNTHGHDDHVGGNALFKERYNIPVCIHKLDFGSVEELQTGRLPTVLLDDGSTVEFGDEKLSVFHTPGHTPGSVCLVGEKLVFTGDTLFAGSIGRSDFEGGSMHDMKASLQKLTKLSDYLLVYPGHGETSLIGQEKKVNPFLTGEYALF